MMAAIWCNYATGKLFEGMQNDAVTLEKCLALTLRNMCMFQQSYSSAFILGKWELYSQKKPHASVCEALFVIGEEQKPNNINEWKHRDSIPLTNE